MAPRIQIGIYNLMISKMLMNFLEFDAKNVKTTSKTGSNFKFAIQIPLIY